MTRRDLLRTGALAGAALAARPALALASGPTPVLPRRPGDGIGFVAPGGVVYTRSILDEARETL